MPSAEQMARANPPDMRAAVGQSLVNLERAIERLSGEDVHILSFTVTTPAAGRPDYLVVVRVEQGGERLVAFHNADTVWEALKGMADRIVNGTLKLKEDQYANSKR